MYIFKFHDPYKQSYVHVDHVRSNFRQSCFLVVVVVYSACV